MKKVLEDLQNSFIVDKHQSLQFLVNYIKFKDLIKKFPNVNSGDLDSCKHYLINLLSESNTPKVKLVTYSHAVVIFEYPNTEWNVEEIENLINNLADLEEIIENEKSQSKFISQKNMIKLLKLSLTRCLSHASLQQ